MIRPSRDRANRLAGRLETHKDACCLAARNMAMNASQGRVAAADDADLIWPKSISAVAAARAGSLRRAASGPAVGLELSVGEPAGRPRPSLRSRHLLLGRPASTLSAGRFLRNRRRQAPASARAARSAASRDLEFINCFCSTPSGRAAERPTSRALGSPESSARAHIRVQVALAGPESVGGRAGGHLLRKRLRFRQLGPGRPLSSSSSASKTMSARLGSASNYVGAGRSSSELRASSLEIWLELEPSPATIGSTIM